MTWNNENGQVSCRLSIRYCTYMANDPCAICGARTDPGHIALFLDHEHLVCHECGNKYVPELMLVLPIAEMAAGQSFLERRLAELDPPADPANLADAVPF